MKKFNKTMLVPLLGAIALVVKYLLGYEIPDFAIDLLADVILGIVTLWGMFVPPFKHHGEEPAKEVAKSQQVTFGDHGPSI